VKYLKSSAGSPETTAYGVDLYNFALFAMETEDAHWPDYDRDFLSLERTIVPGFSLDNRQTNKP
jgi:hypothetical protein